MPGKRYFYTSRHKKAGLTYPKWRARVRAGAYANPRNWNLVGRKPYVRRRS